MDELFAALEKDLKTFQKGKKTAWYLDHYKDAVYPITFWGQTLNSAEEFFAFYRNQRMNDRSHELSFLYYKYNDDQFELEDLFGEDVTFEIVERTEENEVGDSKGRVIFTLSDGSTIDTRGDLTDFGFQYTIHEMSECPAKLNPILPNLYGVAIFFNFEDVDHIITTALSLQNAIENLYCEVYVREMLEQGHISWIAAKVALARDWEDYLEEPKKCFCLSHFSGLFNFKTIYISPIENNHQLFDEENLTEKF